MPPNLNRRHLLHAKALLAAWGILDHNPIPLLMLVLVQWRVEAIATRE